MRSSYSSYYYIDHNDIGHDELRRFAGDFIMQDNNGKSYLHVDKDKATTKLNFKTFNKPVKIFK